MKINCEKYITSVDYTNILDEQIHVYDYSRKINPNLDN